EDDPADERHPADPPPPAGVVGVVQAPHRDGDAGDEQRDPHDDVEDDAGGRGRVGDPAHDPVGDGLDQDEPPERGPRCPPPERDYVGHRPADGVDEANRRALQVGERAWAAWRVSAARSVPAGGRASGWIGAVGAALLATRPGAALAGAVLARPLVGVLPLAGLLPLAGVLVLVRTLLARDVLLRTVGALPGSLG